MLTSECISTWITITLHNYTSNGWEYISYMKCDIINQMFRIKIAGATEQVIKYSRQDRKQHQIKEQVNKTELRKIKINQNVYHQTRN